MPFEKVDPIAEAIELQEMFSNDPETKEIFRQYELAHRENSHGLDLLREMRAAAEKRGFLSDEEIETEIQAARADIRAR